MGTYGICEINQNFQSVLGGDSSFNWGFCWRSCDYKDKADGDPDDPYEEAALEYFEDAPQIILFASK